MNKPIFPPKFIFLFDGLGAMVSALLLLLLWMPYAEHIGLPAQALAFLGVTAVVLCIYSLSCHFFVRHHRHVFLGIIAIANVLYAGLTIYEIAIHFQAVPVWGIAYFFGEIGIIGLLSYFELKFAMKAASQPATGG